MDKKKEFEEIEKEFKEKVFQIFKAQIPDTTYDEETGLMTIPSNAISRSSKGKDD